MARVWTVRLKHHIKDGLEPGFTVTVTTQQNVKNWPSLEQKLMDMSYGTIGGCATDTFWDWY
ncbi:MAG: hypothetical protein K2N35_03455 [Muribaculaceae bacterium]|nr:hypothetical protein [Muribaculaceae bacterium]